MSKNKLNELFLRSYIKEVILEKSNFINEKGSINIDSFLKRKKESQKPERKDAYFSLIPRLNSKKANLVFNELKEKGVKLDGEYRLFVFQKNEKNIKTFYEVIKNHEGVNLDSLSETGNYLEDEEKFLLKTINDNDPIILAQAGGDYHDWLTGSNNISRSKINMISWALHDLHHPLEGKSGAFFSPRSDEHDYKKETETLGNSEDLKQFHWQNLENFFKGENFTSTVKGNDIYASMWAYVLINIRNEGDIIDICKKKKLSNEIQNYMYLMLKKVIKFEEEYLKDMAGKVIVSYSMD